LAVSKEQLRVERDLIQTAWADLQQLPAPWDNSSTTICPTAPADIVEFGGLQADDSMVSILDLTSEPSSEIEAPLRESDDRPTELIAPAKETAPTIIPTPIKVSTPPPADPFAEKFDEEEVVIDSFAAWDDMFRREAPRVENCRDPEFASLVQAAIDNSPIAHACMSPRASYDDEFESTHEEWQPLRLAVLSDPVPLRPIPLVAPASRPGPLSRDATPTDSVDESDDWPELAEYSSPAAVFSESFGKPAQGRGARDNDPILVIEEDAPATTLSDSQVRHEDYRHLFSRLHSG
jgi:hypothetical protein